MPNQVVRPVLEESWALLIHDDEEVPGALLDRFLEGVAACLRQNDPRHPCPQDARLARIRFSRARRLCATEIAPPPPQAIMPFPQRVTLPLRRYHSLSSTSAIHRHAEPDFPLRHSKTLASAAVRSPLQRMISCRKPKERACSRRLCVSYVGTRKACIEDVDVDFLMGSSNGQGIPVDYNHSLAWTLSS